MINKLHEIPTFSLFNNYEIIRKMKFKINEIIDAINSPAPTPSGSGINYSLEEQKIGTAFGEDLYQQSFIINTTTDLTDGEYSLPNYVKNIYNLSCIISDVTIEEAMTNGRNSSMLNYYVSTANRAGINSTDYFNDGETEVLACLTFTLGANPAFSPYAIATIQYTRRTA